jgi:transposase
MNDGATRACAECVALARENRALAARLAVIENKAAALESDLAKAQKNSANSSKSPSSDIVKPPRDGKAQGWRKKRRKAGGQPGHARHERPAFTDDQIDQTREHTLDVCPDCGGPLTPTDEVARVVQQVEIVRAPIKITEHRALVCRCRRCRTTHVARLPAAVVRAGLAGPRLTALVAYLKGACHCSFSTVRKFLRDVVGVTISRGHLRNLCGKVERGLTPAYDELLADLPRQPRLNIDETGHKERGQALWTWCFRAPLFTLFKISPSRGSDVLLDVLGAEFDGVLGCDYFSAYRKYMRLNQNALVQFCLAHLIRDVKFLVEHPDSRNRAYGRRVLDKLRAMFSLIHRRDKLSARDFAGQLEDAGNEVWAEATYRVPRTPEAENLAERFHAHGESYLRFITTPGIEPTNNLAEQAIRFVVLDRHVTQGTRGVAGRRWSERIWTAIATCAQQGRSVFQFLERTIRAVFAGKASPSLLLSDTS